MPWNDQSGGSNEGGGNPWGSGPRQPWGNQPRPQGGQGPDLEDLMRRVQSRWRGGGRRGDDKPGSGRGALVLGALVLLGWAASGVYVIDEGELGVVTRFGAFQSVAAPGFGVHLPWPIESIQVEKFTEQRRLEIGQRDGARNTDESLMLTRDESIVEVNFTVFWQLKDVKDFVFNVYEPDRLVFAVSESAMREVIGQRDLEQIITTQRSEVEGATRDLMQRTLESYGTGVTVTQVQLQSVTAPSDVIEAFNDVLRAEQEREATINQANGYRNQVVPQARGEAQKLLQESEAYREQAVRDANGEASRFSQIYEQYRANPRVTRERLYIETLERVYGKADKVVIDGRSSALPFLPLDRLFGNRPAARDAQQPPAQAPQP